VQGEGAGGRAPKSPAMRRPSSVAAVLVLTAVALSLPFTLAVATSAFAQEPEPPTGGPQEPGGQPQQPGEQPTTTTPTTQAPGTTGGQLPRTGWDAGLYFAIGIVLLLVGARLRVLTRIKRVVQRVRRRRPEVALREALEPIRVARLSPPGQDPAEGPLHVEPSTPTARRAAEVGTRADD
jgi:hypothetical protein